uniref:Uncharacterized protein n=1 Tax=Rhipicephalus zambeziensis TaxID=60191 RepID=A0A224Y5J1_9ACAR
MAPLMFLFCMSYKHCREEPTCSNEGVVTWNFSLSFVYENALHRPLAVLCYRMTPGGHHCRTHQDSIEMIFSTRSAGLHIGSKLDVDVFCCYIPRLSPTLPELQVLSGFLDFVCFSQSFARLHETWDVE